MPGATLERRWTEDNERELRAFCGIDVVADRYIALYAELDAVTALGHLADE